MVDDAETFLQRWARLKAEGDKSAKTAPASTAAPETQPKSDAEIRPAAPQELPSIDELTKDSDFTQFLREGVPEELKRLALRKLWRTDPVFANLDGLIDYGEDFGALFRNPGPVATLFRIGRGMPGPGESEEPESVEVAADRDIKRPAAEESETQPIVKSSENASAAVSHEKGAADREDPPSKGSS